MARDGQCVESKLYNLAIKTMCHSCLSVKADQTGMSAIGKTYNVSAFPTVILFRGGVEVDRISAPAGGSEGSSVTNGRVVERSVRWLNASMT
jgi:hypothetical protein